MGKASSLTIINSLAVYSTIYLQFPFFAILKVGSLSNYFSLDQRVQIIVNRLKCQNNGVGLSENFTYFANSNIPGL